jgi:hypothetical protein
MAEAEWVKCAMDAGTENGGRSCSIPVRDKFYCQVSQEVCASCPVPKLAAALAAVSTVGDEEHDAPKYWGKTFRGVDEALALYRKGGR